MIEYLIIPEKEFVVARMIGNVEFDELLNWHLHLAKQPDYHAYYRGIADMRHAIMNISQQALEDLVKLNREKNIVSGKWVCLVDTPVETALAIDYKHKKADTHEMELFSTVEAATSYLKIDVQSVFTKLNMSNKKTQFELDV